MGERPGGLMVIEVMETATAVFFLKQGCCSAGDFAWKKIVESFSTRIDRVTGVAIITCVSNHTA